MNKEGQNNFCMLKIIISFVSKAYKNLAFLLKEVLSLLKSFIPKSIKVAEYIRDMSKESGMPPLMWFPRREHFFTASVGHG